MNPNKTFPVRAVVIGVFLSLGCGCPGVDSKPTIETKTHEMEIGLGYESPGEEPTLFAPGLVSTGLSERDIALGKDGREMLFTVMTPAKSGVIVRIQKNDQGWSLPETIGFSGTYSDLEPVFSADGNEIYFSSNRPRSGDREKRTDYDIWRVTREGSGWSEPTNIGLPVNTTGNEFYPSLSRDGTLYFTATRADSEGGEDLYRARRIGSGYAAPTNLGTGVNSKSGEYNGLVDPDERYIIFGSHGRGDGFGGGDLYISFLDATGVWGPAINMGPRVNGPSLDYCPFVTADEELFFFTSTRDREKAAAEGRLTYENLQRMQRARSTTGGQDIYWMTAGFIMGLSEAQSNPE